MMAAIIQINQLSKYYNRRAAVDQLDLTVEEGDIFGFVGPNGAGKTTTIRIMTTLLEPTQGELLIAGHSVRRDPRHIRRIVGYMPDIFGVYNDMLVWEYLDFFASCYQIPNTQLPGIIKDLLELVDLSHRRDDPIESLSRGMKQRLSLARTLIHDPQVLVLDEPASGLDPRARIEIRELLVELARMGKTIFFSTHILADVAEICTRVGIIEAGRLVAVGSLDELQRHLIPHRRIIISVLRQIQAAVTLLQDLPGVITAAELPTNNHPASQRIQIMFQGDDASLSNILYALIQSGIPVVDFSEQHRDLEEVFMRTTQGMVT
jgi:ABC-2 type transport system ATP-binding protein